MANRLLGIPSPNTGPLRVIRVLGASVAAEPIRAYRIDTYGQFRSKGVAATAFDLMTAPLLPRARLPRSHTDRSKYSPRACFASGHA